ncbi:hypothetical protein JRQ81_004151 [Phrynocephalus forsythii]|uniref:CST complex subunit CTC1 n=1 Tax=Phrynocephalus forsythii TaxID=171643 RepID=A0A9Q0XL25_9SAUR|nr:hypothetical protein JRQ81_004151 [Phrynocephalus forsythii]
MAEPPAALGGELAPSSCSASRSALRHHWLQAMQGSGGTGDPPVEAAWRCLVRALGPCTGRGGADDLLQGYSFVTISELQSQQRMPCCSHLTWSSDEFNAWAHQGIGILPEHRILPRTHLILFGYLTDQIVGGKDLPNGSLYLRDSTGMLPCVVLHFKLEWLGFPLLLPGWIYIPQSGPNTGGYLEILGDPIQVMSGPMKTVGVVPFFYPGQAAQLLRSRPQCKTKAKWNVAGELVRLSSILRIHHKTYFFLFLKCSISAACVPVLVQNPPQLVWHNALQLGCWYILTNLKISGFKASRLKVFLACSSSDLLPHCIEHVKDPFLPNASEGGAVVSAPAITCVTSNNLLELEEEENTLAPVKTSMMSSYTGTITKVLNAQAGLFELDNRFILCLTYQPLLHSGRGLRPGAHIELRDVHLMQELVATSLPVFGACLHSTVALKSFSKYSTLHQPFAASFGNLYIRLLLRYNLSLPLYLHLVHLLETFEQRFCYFIQQAAGAAEKFVVPILDSFGLSREQERNIDQEILAESHQCPIDKTQMLERPCQIPPFSLLHTMAVKKCWETFSPRQQLRSVEEVCSLSAQELNRRMAWSYDTLSAESFQPRVVLLGVLECSRRGSLHLRDKTKTFPCVIFYRDGRPFADTSLLGCLLQIEIFQLVMERFLQSDFPSWQELESHEYIKEKRTRLYVQFFYEDVKILHAPGKRVPMHLRALEGTSSGAEDHDGSKAEPRSPEGEIPDEGRAVLDGSPPARAKSGAQKAGGVSRLFLVIQKEGLLERNYREPSEGQRAAREAHLCFQATVQWMSQAELCKEPGDPGSQAEQHKAGRREEASEARQQGTCQRTGKQVLLVFRKKSLRWFSFLHPDHVYQLIFPECSDLDVLDKCVPLAPGRPGNGLSCFSFLLVPDKAYLQHVSHVSQMVSPVSERKQNQFSIAEILSPSFTDSLVSFSGEIVERSLCGPAVSSLKKKGNCLPWHYTVKLSISPTASSPLLLDVYVDHVFLLDLQGMLPGARIIFQNQERKVSRVLVEDGTSEFVVVCRNQQVQQVLGLGPKEWSILQSHIRSKGSVSIYSSASSAPEGTEELEDVLMWYLRGLCRSPVVCRTLRLTCQLNRAPSEAERTGAGHLTRFLSNEVEFLSQTRPRRCLVCLNIQEAP